MKCFHMIISFEKIDTFPKKLLRWTKTKERICINAHLKVIHGVPLCIAANKI